ncbi:MAG: type II toxin-antitoxin system VapC family toxin [Candidatus Cloacimonetes bacterium]|nr:type II toxin-antitoxin system VapC family toxin [Candidatus Cloacimonadota bacterium]
MKYLIDTNVLIWYIENQPEIDDTVLDIIDNLENKIFVSVVSIWEIALKTSKNKLFLGINIDELYKIIKNRKFELLPIKQKHLKGIINLPQIHKDPFDRLLVATAKSENLVLITSEKDIHQYDVDWIW